jgi:hypothetical protein
MGSVYDKRESEYFNALLDRWRENNPTLDIKDEVIKIIMYKRDFKAKLYDCLYLNTIHEQIPNRLINIMVERMERIKKFKTTKYGLYRDCEDYLTKTDWFFDLTRENQNLIRFDFYDSIILGIHDAFCRIEYYKKKSNQKENR